MERIKSIVEKLLSVVKPDEIEIEARIKGLIVNDTSIDRLINSKVCEWEDHVYIERRRISKNNRNCVYRHRSTLPTAEFLLVNTDAYRELLTEQRSKDLSVTTFRQGPETSRMMQILRSSEGDLVCKSSIVAEDMPESWCKVHVSTEISKPAAMLQTMLSMKGSIIRRLRGMIQSHWIDITLATDNAHMRPSQYNSFTGTDMTGVAKRVEIEVPDVKKFDPQLMMDVVGIVCSIMQESHVPVASIILQNNTARYEGRKQLQSGENSALGMLDWMTFRHLTTMTFTKFCISSNKYQKPVTMEVKDLYRVLDSPEQWLVTPKVDGVRRFIANIEDLTCAIDITGNIMYMYENTLSTKSKGHDITILDCEYLDKTYYIIDIIVDKGRYVGDIPFNEREAMILDYKEEHLDAAAKTYGYDILFKEYVKFKSFRNLQHIYHNWTNKYKIDGMIFMNTTEGYMQHVIKWKAHSTVDLRVTEDGNLLTCDGWSIDIPWDPPCVEHLAPDDARCIELGKDSLVRTATNKVDIWEFMLVNGRLQPTRPRPDKPQANSLEIVNKNMKQSGIGTIFTGIGSYMMRKYHNRVKREMLKSSNIAQATILDIGTGQGGDITKWMTSKKVYCVEPDAEAIREMDIRMQNITSSPNILANNIYLRDIDISEIKDKIDVFVAFFCMNQWNKDDWDALKRVINTRGSKKCRLIAIALTNPCEGNNVCWKLSLSSENPAQGLGNYEISIHNTRITGIRENVVNARKLDVLMAECGLIYAEHIRLNESEDLMTEHEHRLSSMYTAFTYKKTFWKNSRRTV